MQLSSQGVQYVLYTLILTVLRLFLFILYVCSTARINRRILAGLAIPESIDDLALLRTRFDGLERDVRKREPQLAQIEEKRKLLPSDVADSNTALNEATQAVHDEWRELNKLLDEKKNEFIHAEILRKFQLDGSETELWIEEKAKVIDATRDYGDSLPGVIALQRKLATMERDVKAIKCRINELHQGAEEIVLKYPSDEPLMKEVLNSVEESFARLEALLKARAEKLGQVGNLQTVLCDMAEFEVNA